MRYVLITAARNESAYIARTIESVITQSVLPVQWDIVSDGSTDGTDEIVKSYARSHSFIKLLRIEDGASRNFASQAYALNHALSDLWKESFNFIGCLDADISFSSEYYKTILEAFMIDPAIGVAGGAIHEEVAGRFKPRPTNSSFSVAGAVQMFRRECFEKIGQFTPVPHGGLDTVAELTAKMHGYQVRTIAKVKVYHLRATGTAGGFLSGSYKAGLMEYEIGYHPLYQLFVCARRIPRGIPLLCSIIRCIGFMSSYLTHRRRMVSHEMMTFLRKEQMYRLMLFAKKIFLCT